MNKQTNTKWEQRLLRIERDKMKKNKKTQKKERSGYKNVCN